MNEDKEITEIKNKAPAVLDSQQNNGLISLVERMAIDPEIDPDRIEQAFDMYKRVRAMDAEAEFNKAMARAQANMAPVSANLLNEHTGKKFANLSAIHKALKPIWTAEGLSFSAKPGESGKDNFVKVIVTLRHSGGHSESSSHDFPLDVAGSGGKINKTQIQGIGSSFEYGRRYLELLMMDVSVEGKDNDGNDPNATIDEETAAWIKTELQNIGADVNKFCRLTKCENVDSMQAKHLKLAKDFITAKRKEKNRGTPTDRTK